MSHMHNTVATLNFSYNNYEYIYVNAHLYPGMDIKKKLQHIENLSLLLEEITTNNPTAHFLLSGR